MMNDLRELNYAYKREEEILVEADRRAKEGRANNAIGSYDLLFGVTICRDLDIGAHPESGVPMNEWSRRLRVLEIGYGDCVGISTAVNRYRVPQDHITGIEVLPEADKVARELFPAASWFLLDGDPDSLPKLLKYWGAEGIRFDLVVARHVMERIPNPDKVLEGVASVLRGTHPRLRVPRGVYVQITPPKSRQDYMISPDMPGGGEIPHLSDFDAIWNKQTKSWEPGGWPDLIRDAGMEAYRTTRHLRKSLAGRHEICIWSLRRGMD